MNAVQIIVKDLNLSLSYIFKLKDLLSNVSKSRSAEDLSSQLESVKEISSTYVSFDDMRIMLLDPYLKTFFETVGAADQGISNPRFRPSIPETDQLCYELSDTKSPVLVANRDSPKFQPVMEEIFERKVASYCVVPMFDDAKLLKGTPA